MPSADFELSDRLNSGLKHIASARSSDAVLVATAAAARELADAAGLCAVPSNHSTCATSTIGDGTIATLDSNCALQRLVTAAVDGNEALVHLRPSLEIELPSGRRLLAEILLTVPLGADSGYLALAFFWRDGMTPGPRQLALLPSLAWTACLALQSQHRESELRACRAEHRSHLVELQHRSRNVLALVRSIIRLSGQGTESSEEFAAHLEARISALARAQGALLIDQRTGPELEDLVRGELMANAVRDSQFAIAGPSLRLTPDATETMALTLHELTTNALKFGALTTPQGRIEIGWNILATPAPTLHWRWLESNVKVANTSPQRRGFGRELIERVLPYELNALTRFTLAVDGVRCEIELPLNEHTAAQTARS